MMASDDRQPLELGSPQWATLEHAFGPAADTPGLLGRLVDEDEAVLDELAGSIFHQGSVYPASLAAFPHLVRTADGHPNPQWRARLLIFAGGIHAGLVSGHPRGRAAARLLGERLEHAQRDSVPRALQLAQSTLDEISDAMVGVYLLQAAASFSGYHTLGRALEGLAAKEVSVRCPSCNADLYVWPEGGKGLKVTAQASVGNPKARFGLVSTSGALAPSDSAPREWLRAQCHRSSLAGSREQLDALFGRADCPACDSPFSLMRALEADEQ